MGDNQQTGEPSWYVTSHPGQLSLAIRLWVSAMSSSENWDVYKHTAWCTSPVSMVWQCKLVSDWGLRKRRSAPPCGPYGSGSTLRYVTLLPLHSTNKQYNTFLLQIILRQIIQITDITYRQILSVTVGSNVMTHRQKVSWYWIWKPTLPLSVVTILQHIHCTNTTNWQPVGLTVSNGSHCNLPPSSKLYGTRINI